MVGYIDGGVVTYWLGQPFPSGLLGKAGEDVWVDVWDVWEDGTFW